MIYSAKEIIDLARQLSQTQNSEAFSFQLLVHLLNNVYTGLYNELATSQAFMSEFRFTGTEADLPSDCYKIVSVARNSKYFYLNQSSNSYNIPGTYSIENGSIRINGENGGEYIVKYQTLPEVLTASGDVDYLDIGANTEFVPFLEYDMLKKEYIVYYKDWSDVYHTYNIDTKEDLALEVAPTRPVRPFNNKAITFSFTDGVLSQVLWNGEDVTDYFDKSEQNLHCGFVSNDNEHITATYFDEDSNTPFIYVFDTSWDSVEINPWISKGKYFPFSTGDILTDDETGKYLLIYDDKGNLAVTTYVPDTILEFPENTFFDVLIDRLAVQLGSLNGLTNEGLQTKLSQDEVSFYASINRSNQGCRIRNDVGVRNSRLF